MIRLLPGEGLRALEALDLVGRDPDAPGLVFATAAILLNARNLTVCDRGNAPDGTKCTLPPDVVYPAIFENTREFVDRLPSTPSTRCSISAPAPGSPRCGARPLRDTFGPRYSAAVHALRRIQPAPGGFGKHDRWWKANVRSCGGADLRPDRNPSPLYSRQTDRVDFSRWRGRRRADHPPGGGRSAAILATGRKVLCATDGDRPGGRGIRAAHP